MASIAWLIAALARCKFDRTMWFDQHASSVVDQRRLQRLQRPVAAFEDHVGRGRCVSDFFLVHLVPLITHG